MALGDARFKRQIAKALGRRVEALEKELAVPVKFVLRKEMMNIMSSGLMTGMNELNVPVV